MTKPNRQAGQQAVDAGTYFSKVVAVNIDNAIDHYLHEITACDGWPERGDTVAVHTSTISDPTSSAADARTTCNQKHDKLQDALRDACDAIRVVNWAALDLLSYRVPKNVTQPNQAKLCRDGITDATRQGSIEWHDPACMMTGTKLGLCQKHYDARRYWLNVHGIPDTGEHLPEVVRSTREVLVRDGYAGAVHVMYARVDL